MNAYKKYSSESDPEDVMKEYYENNYQDYFDSTFHIDPAPFLSPLCCFLKPQAKILDIGCGSGRDLLWLRNQGFLPTGFELSPNLAHLAELHSSCPVIIGDYCCFDFSTLTFDALVLVGSLVHQPRSELPAMLASFALALAAGGYMLITMKEGNGNYSATDGRVFTLWNQNEIEEIYKMSGFEIIDFSRKVSMLRPEDIWLGHVLRLSYDR